VSILPVKLPANGQFRQPRPHTLTTIYHGADRNGSHSGRRTIELTAHRVASLPSGHAIRCAINAVTGSRCVTGVGRPSHFAQSYVSIHISAIEFTRSLKANPHADAQAQIRRHACSYASVATAIPAVTTSVSTPETSSNTPSAGAFFEFSRPVSVSECCLGSLALWRTAPERWASSNAWAGASSVDQATQVGPDCLHSPAWPRAAVICTASCWREYPWVRDVGSTSPASTRWPA
jgi:hypothetical protein